MSNCFNSCDKYLVIGEIFTRLSLRDLFSFSGVNRYCYYLSCYDDSLYQRSVQREFPCYCSIHKPATYRTWRQYARYLSIPNNWRRVVYRGQVNLLPNHLVRSNHLKEMFPEFSVGFVVNRNKVFVQKFVYSTKDIVILNNEMIHSDDFFVKDGDVILIGALAEELNNLVNKGHLIKDTYSREFYYNRSLVVDNNIGILNERDIYNVLMEKGFSYDYDRGGTSIMNRGLLLFLIIDNIRALGLC